MGRHNQDSYDRERENNRPYRDPRNSGRPARSRDDAENQADGFPERSNDRDYGYQTRDRYPNDYGIGGPWAPAEHYREREEMRNRHEDGDDRSRGMSSRNPERYDTGRPYGGEGYAEHELTSDRGASRRGESGRGNFGMESDYQRGREGWRPMSDRSDAEQATNRSGSTANMSGSELRGSIQNHAGKGPKGWKRSDERIREDLNERLTDHHAIDASDIEVAVTNGDVTLSGTVSDRYAKRHAEDLAESLSGVCHVQNNIRVVQSQRAERSTEELSTSERSMNERSTPTLPSPPSTTKPQSPKHH